MKDMKAQLVALFRTAMKRLKDVIEQEGDLSELCGVGWVVDDDLLAMSAFFCFEHDFNAESEAFERLSPVEWPRSDESSLVDVNRHLNEIPGGIRSLSYRERVRVVFDACNAALASYDECSVIGTSVFVTVTGADPNPVLVDEEERLVREFNSSQHYDRWCHDLR